MPDQKKGCLYLLLCMKKSLVRRNDSGAESP